MVKGSDSQVGRILSAAGGALRDAYWVLVVLTAVSVVLVVVQVHDLRQAVKGQTYQDITSKMFDIDKQFFEYPRFRKYFYDGADPRAEPELADDERIQVQVLAEWLTDFFDSIHQQKDTMPENAYDEWLAYMVEVYQNSPEIQRYLQENTEWYSDFYEELSEAVDHAGMARPSE
jgi:hypothetical protein